MRACYRPKRMRASNGSTSLIPGLLGPDLHRAVFVLPRRVHSTDDAGNAPDVREPLRDAGAVLIRVVVAGENLPQTQIREEAAVLDRKSTRLNSSHLGI